MTDPRQEPAVRQGCKVAFPPPVEEEGGDGGRQRVRAADRFPIDEGLPGPQLMPVAEGYAPRPNFQLQENGEVYHYPQPHAQEVGDGNGDPNPEIVIPLQATNNCGNSKLLTGRDSYRKSWHVEESYQPPSCDQNSQMVGQQVLRYHPTDGVNVNLHHHDHTNSYRRLEEHQTAL